MQKRGIRELMDKFAQDQVRVREREGLGEGMLALRVGRDIPTLSILPTVHQGGDTRFAVLPGILHSEAIWGAGTTEYALEAMRWVPFKHNTHILIHTYSYTQHTSNTLKNVHGLAVGLRPRARSTCARSTRMLCCRCSSSTTS